MESGKFGGVIDIATELQQSIPLLIKRRIALFFCHCKFVDIGFRVGFKGIAIWLQAQTDAKLVELIALGGLFAVEYDGAGNIVVGFRVGQCDVLFWGLCGPAIA